MSGKLVLTMRRLSPTLIVFMDSKLHNFAFIDSQNLNLSIREQGWILDFAKFYRYKYKYSSLLRGFSGHITFLNNTRFKLGK